MFSKLECHNSAKTLCNQAKFFRQGNNWGFFVSHPSLNIVSNDLSIKSKLTFFSDTEAYSVKRYKTRNEAFNDIQVIFKENNLGGLEDKFILQNRYILKDYPFCEVKKDKKKKGWMIKFNEGALSGKFKDDYIRTVYHMQVEFFPKELSNIVFQTRREALLALECWVKTL